MTTPYRRRYAEDPEFRRRKIEAGRRYRKANRETVNARRRRRYFQDPEFRKRLAAIHKRTERKRQLRQYGLTIDDYVALLSKQGGACAICKTMPDGTPCVDHCHGCGTVRGILCRACNTGLGLYRDRRSLMSAAIAYLEAHHCGCSHPAKDR
jgi:hypothetical protein